MSAVVSNLAKETAALHNFKSRPLPIRCREVELPECFRECIRTLDGATRFLEKFGRAHPEFQNKNKRGTVMAPMELVKQYYTFPFDFYPFQDRTVNKLAPLPRSGWWLDMGLGKTALSTAAALYKTLNGSERILVIVPPILLTGWSRFLQSVSDKETGPLDVLVYRGTPKQRNAMSLEHDIVLVGLQIFKRDYARFVEEFADEKLVIIVDEAHCLKNVGTDNYEKVRGLAEGKDLLLLTGTPINSPIDGYAMIKLVSPNIYRTLHQFENIHVGKRGFGDVVVSWNNLDLLAENLACNSVRLLKEEVIADMPPVTYQPMYYDLEPEHLRLYRRLAEEHLLPLKDGGKIDATTIQGLLHALGQIVCNWGHFAQDPNKVSNGFQLIDETLDELGNGKLVLFSNYKLTNRAALAYLKQYNPVAIFGDVGAKDRDKAIDRFVDDPSCRVFVGNPASAGYGIDRLQHVCSTVMFLEPPISVKDFTQALARVHRIGQTKPVTAKLATACLTLQERQLKSLMDKEDLVQSLTGGYQSIREALGLK